MKCDRCLEERTRYKYLKHHYCLNCLWAIYDTNKLQLEDLKLQIKRITKQIEVTLKKYQMEQTK